MCGGIKALISSTERVLLSKTQPLLIVFDYRVSCNVPSPQIVKTFRIVSRGGGGRGKGNTAKLGLIFRNGNQIAFETVLVIGRVETFGWAVLSVILSVLCLFWSWLKHALDLSAWCVMLYRSSLWSWIRLIAVVDSSTVFRFDLVQSFGVVLALVLALIIGGGIDFRMVLTRARSFLLFVCH